MPNTPIDLSKLSNQSTKMTGSLNDLAEAKLDISNMNGKRVLVTGMFDQQNKSLTVENSSDIELLRPIIPSPTPVESPINNEL